MRRFQSILALAAGSVLVLAPVAAQAAIFGSSAPAADSAPAASLNFRGPAGSLTGKWAYHSIAISGDPRASMAKLALGSSEFDLTEQGGKITGTRPAGKGKTYPVTGFVVYASRRAP